MVWSQYREGGLSERLNGVTHDPLKRDPRLSVVPEDLFGGANFPQYEQQAPSRR